MKVENGKFYFIKDEFFDTFKDYKLIEDDKSLERRFDTITVGEPSFEDNLAILQSLKCEFEKYYNL